MAKQKPHSWLQTAKTLGLIGQRSRQQRYRAFVEAGGDEETRQFYGQARQSPFLGSEPFKRYVAKRLRKVGRPPPPEREVSEARLLRPVLSLDQITNSVARAYRVPVAALLRLQKARGNTNQPRAVALYLARRVAGLPLQQITDRFHLNHYGSVSGAVKRLEYQMETDRTLAKQVQRLAELLKNH